MYDKANEYEKTIETEVKKRFKNLVLNEFDLIFNKKYGLTVFNGPALRSKLKFKEFVPCKS